MNCNNLNLPEPQPSFRLPLSKETVVSDGDFHEAEADRQGGSHRKIASLPTAFFDAVKEVPCSRETVLPLYC